MQIGVYAAIQPHCDADLIIMDGNNIYNCWLMPNIDLENGNPEDLPHWRIEKIETLETNGVTTYRRLYPNGNPSFQFIANQYASYNYAYKK